jgi:catechol 2,3-dioxygenase-like lactoylglutathione lyase family enzyme
MVVARAGLTQLPRTCDAQARDRRHADDAAIGTMWLHRSREDPTMLLEAHAVATVATDDIPAARAFYVDTLGLTPRQEDQGAFALRLRDGSDLMVYHRPQHTPPANTAVNFVVQDVRAEVKALRARGVTFEEYDLPEFEIKTLDGVASDGQGMALAWFKDPAGNILALLQMPSA